MNKYNPLRNLQDMNSSNNPSDGKSKSECRDERARLQLQDAVHDFQQEPSNVSRKH